MINKTSIKNKVRFYWIINYLSWINDLHKKTIINFTTLFFKKLEIQYLTMALLLGRAVILNSISPFALAFFAIMYYLKKDKLLLISLSLIFGAKFSTLDNQAIFIFSGMIIYLLLLKWKSEITYAPFLVAVAILIPKSVFYLYYNIDEFYLWLMTFTESILGFVLTLIFIQAIPILIFKHKKMSLNQEEVIALTIVLASVITGTIGWNVDGYSVENIISRYFILIFSFTGGGTIGASVGVVTGLILSLSNPSDIYQISLLAFSGLLAGLLKQGKKLGVIIGFLLGTTILSVYLGTQDDIWKTFMESSLAVVIFLLTPKDLLNNIAKYIPGTNEFHNYYQDYLTQMKNITSNKIERFASMFNQLANSFQEISYAPKFEQTEQIDHFINQITKTNCKICWKRRKCWNEDFFKTYCIITELMTIIETNKTFSKKNIPKHILEHCIKGEQVAYQLVDIYESYEEHLYWKKQLEESRLLVSEQLHGVSKVMKDFAYEILKEDKEYLIHEEQIHHSLETFGLSILQVNILNLEQGNVEIEVLQPSCNGEDRCVKMVAPLISEVIGESIVVKEKECNYKNDGSCKIILKSAKIYEIETGFASAAKDGKWLSGDSFSTIEIGNGKYAIALSDGMGNGERAQKESNATLEILKQLLHSGFDKTFSVKTVNSILLLRSPEEIFSTVDLAIIDLFNGNTEFLKVGSAPSFIKRGKEIFTISGNNLPIGIIQNIDIDSNEFKLQAEDLLIMVTDGIYDSPKHITNKEIWIKRVIQEIETNSPQELADLILEKTIRDKKGVIGDDMTVIVSRIEKYKPEWSIKASGISKLDRIKEAN